MKTPFNLMLIPFLMSISISILLSSCDGGKLQPLNSIRIPEYSDSDYVKLLNDRNPEIVYNAICNLISGAYNYGSVLSSDTIRDTIVKYRARLIFNKITKLLSSDNEWIVCASLRFMSDFGMNYSKKDEIAQNLLKVNLKSKSIKLEFINALTALVGANPKPFINVLDSYLKSKSWLISSYSYKIVPYMPNNDFNAFLLIKYKTSAEYDKLLIIETFGDKYNDTVLKFILSELNTEQNKKIKLYLAKQLGNARNMDMVLSWLNTNYEILSDIKEPIAEYYVSSFENPAIAKVLKVLLSKNMIPEELILDKDSKCLALLYKTCYQNKNKETIYIKELLPEMLKNKKFRDKWFEFIRENEKSYYSDEFIAKQLNLINEFKQKSASLYDVNKIDEKYKNSYLTQIQNLREEFKNKK